MGSARLSRGRRAGGGQGAPLGDEDDAARRLQHAGGRMGQNILVVDLDPINHHGGRVGQCQAGAVIIDGRQIGEKRIEGILTHLTVGAQFNQHAFPKFLYCHCRLHVSMKITVGNLASPPTVDTRHRC